MAVTASPTIISSKDKINYEHNSIYPQMKLLDLLEKDPIVKIQEGGWLALSYEAVNGIFRDKRFLTSNPAFSMHKTLLKNHNRIVKTVATRPLKYLISKNKQVKITKPWLVFANPPIHSRLRKLTQTAFTPRAIKALKPRMEEITYQLLDQLENKKEFDLIKEFAYPLPITMITEVLGISPENSSKFKKWSQDILFGFGLAGLDKERRAKTAQTIDELRSFLGKEITKKRANPGEDVISYFITANEDNERLTESEMISNIVLLLIAGHETTVNLLGNTIHSLLTHPDQFELLKSDTSLLTNTIEESLRFDPPLLATFRKTSEDMDFMGYHIAKGETIDLSLFTANRDPVVFERPNTFNITRENSKNHLSFGQGIHYCLGSPLARAEGEIAFSEIIKRYPNIELSKKHTPQRFRSVGFSSFGELFVTK